MRIAPSEIKSPSRPARPECISYVAMIKKFLHRRTAAVLVSVITLVWTSSATAFKGDEKVANYSIESVFCSGCVEAISAIVLEVSDVVSVEVDVENHSLSVVFDEDNTDAESLMERIKKETALDLVFLSVKSLGQE